MKYLIAFFIPPLYFLMRGKWVGFIINSFFYGMACLLLLMLLIPIAPFFWLPAMIHAFYHVKKEAVVEHAEILATKMAEKMRETPSLPK